MAQVIVDDGLGALVALDAFAGEHLTSMTVPAIPDGTRSEVSFTSKPFAEDGAQQLFFRRQLGFALRRDLADQHVAGFDFGADVNDAGIVQTGKLGFAEGGDIAGDFLRSELGVAGDDRQFLRCGSRCSGLRQRRARRSGSSLRSCSRSTA